MDPQQARPNDDGFGAYINAIGWLLLSLSGIVVGARIWAKVSARKGLWWDDYIVLAAWVSMSPSHNSAAAARAMTAGAYPLDFLTRRTHRSCSWQT